MQVKLTRGDWLWPALWLMPLHEHYGSWPPSGEIDMMESRGNGPNYTSKMGIPLGANAFSSCFHFGPAWNQDGYPSANSLE